MLAWMALAAAAVLEPCDMLDAAGDAEARRCYREVAMSSADDLARAVALWRVGDVAGANSAFRDAAEQRPRDASVLAEWGWLYLDVHQQADAESLFRNALTRDADNVRALLGLAELSLLRFDPGVQRYLERVLTLRPDSPEARLLLARLALESGDTGRAREVLDGLLGRSVGGRPALDAYALLAAADALDDVVPSVWTARALARNPHFSPAHAVPAHYYVINRRYREAVERYRQAVQVDPGDWMAHAELGINLLRVDRLGAARNHLHQAYDGDPYNPLTVNSLRLLDLLESFPEIDDGVVRLRAPEPQATVLAPYVQALSARARSEMGARYGYRPGGPVVVEIYRHHDDFAVRTAGLPGLGILGATFGDVLVMDGPAAKSIDDGFDWASALWHELAHVYTLGATDNRVSRWFSEGVSVMEERRYGPSAQQSVSLAFLDALAQGRLLPIARLDEGFLRPRGPGQIGVSYVQAGLTCEFIEARFPGGLGAMLAVYREGADTTAAIRRGLGVEPDELDQIFAAHLDARFANLLERLDSYRRQLEVARRAAAAADWPAAREAAREAVALYPTYVQMDSGYVVLARAADALGDRALLAATLGQYFERGGRDPWSLSRLAERLAAGGAAEREIEVLGTLVRTVPLDAALQLRRAGRLAAAGRDAEALGAYQAALALEPYDRAEVLLGIATVQYRLGRLEAARRAVLEALEIAPRYDAALDLLLTITRGAAVAGPDRATASDGG